MSKLLKIAADVADFFENFRMMPPCPIHRVSKRCRSVGLSLSVSYDLVIG